MQLSFSTSTSIPIPTSIFPLKEPFKGNLGLCVGSECFGWGCRIRGGPEVGQSQRPYVSGHPSPKTMDHKQWTLCCLYCLYSLLMGYYWAMTLGILQVQVDPNIHASRAIWPLFDGITILHCTVLVLYYTLLYYTVRD